MEHLLLRVGTHVQCTRRRQQLEAELSGRVVFLRGKGHVVIEAQIECAEGCLACLIVEVCDRTELTRRVVQLEVSSFPCLELP